jgi:hypothetical protein
MFSIVRDVQTSLKKPTNVAIVLALTAVSFVAVEWIGYVHWRSFVIPFLILITGRVLYRIGTTRLHQSTVALVFKNASVGLLVYAVALIVGAVIDMVVLDTPHIVFTLMVSMWVWIFVQVERLDTRLIYLPQNTINEITESSDVVCARLADSKINLRAASTNYLHVRESLGLPPDENLVIQ